VIKSQDWSLPWVEPSFFFLLIVLVLDRSSITPNNAPFGIKVTYSVRSRSRRLTATGPDTSPSSPNSCT